MQEWVEPSGSDTMCPQVDSISFDLPGEMDRNVTLTALNLPQPTMVYNYTCIVYISNTTTRIPGLWMNVSTSPSYGNTTLECLLSGGILSPGASGIIEVVWGPIDYGIQQGDINFEVFQCSDMTNCFSCLTNPQCNWCAGPFNRTGRCSGECSAGENVFTPSNRMCPPPEITSFSPNSTSPGGVVRLSVNGYNLAGQEPVITLEEIPCMVRPAYTNTRLECDLAVPSTGGQRLLMVNVTVVESGISSQTFSILLPTILSIEPPYAPEFGGSVVTVSGTNLLVGTSRRLTIGNQSCDILSTNINGSVDEVTCRTSQSDVGNTLLSITIDSGVPSTLISPFDVLRNPGVTNMLLNGSRSELRATFVSGPLDYLLQGRNLGSTIVQTLVFTYNGTEISRYVCEPPSTRDAEFLFCPGRNFSLATELQSGMQIRFQLIMDSVPNVTTPYFTPFSFSLYPDPVFSMGGTSHSLSIFSGSNEIIIPIPGLNIVPVDAISITEIMMGQDFCSNIQITSSEIMCTTDQPINEQQHLNITIGQNTNKYILSLEVNVIEVNPVTQFLDENMALLIATFTIALIILCSFITPICCCCLWIYCTRRRMNRKREEIDDLLSEIHNLEKDLNIKCWEDFKELNTQVGIDEEIEPVPSIPILDFRTYAMRMLFPGIQDHPILHAIEGPRNVEPMVFRKGLERFELLLKDRSFTLAMIHSMEDNQDFSQRDNYNVAGLLITALHDSMPYVTELLFELLGEEINKNVTMNTPKLVLEKTDTITDKLLDDWLAFNLYSYLQGSVGVSIYKLFLGIKWYIESGPVDILTGAAANSLSIEGLLRENIEHRKLQVELDTSYGERILCSVLDCDTITQVKIKLMDQEYRGMEYSRRPKLEDVEVLLLSAGRGGLQLRDNDMTNQEIQKWRKINTLGHYNICDKMVFKLVNRDQKPNFGQVWDYPEANTSELGFAQSTTRLLDLDEERDKVFHLQRDDPEFECKKNATLKRKHYAFDMYLSKLMSTKGFVDKMMVHVFPTLSRDKRFSVPRAAKLIYDFLDQQAEKYDIQDQETIHTWKINSVPLRFWVNLLKNPSILLDVSTNKSIESALTVISQAYTDSCSTKQEIITRHSPNKKLLYYRDVQQYKSRVTQYYKDVKRAPPVWKNNMRFETVDLLSDEEEVLFHSGSAVYGLFNYAQAYKEEITNQLSKESLVDQLQIFEEVCQDITENLYMV